MNFSQQNIACKIISALVQGTFLSFPLFIPFLWCWIRWVFDEVNRAMFFNTGLTHTPQLQLPHPLRINFPPPGEVVNAPWARFIEAYRKLMLSSRDLVVFSLLQNRNTCCIWHLDLQPLTIVKFPTLLRSLQLTPYSSPLALTPTSLHYYNLLSSKNHFYACNIVIDLHQKIILNLRNILF